MIYRVRVIFLVLISTLSTGVEYCAASLSLVACCQLLRMKRVLTSFHRYELKPGIGAESNESKFCVVKETKEILV